MSQTITTADFPTLARQIRDAGLLERRRANYVIRIALTVACAAAGWLALVLIGDSWATLGVAAFLGVIFTQLGFVGHDAGHQQIFSSRRANQLVGLLAGNALIGLSFGWWVPKHSAHHAHPNQIGRDPDVAEGVVFGSPRTRQLIRGRQELLFFPLMALRSVGLHVSGIQHLARRSGPAARVERVLLIAHAMAYLFAVFWVLSPLRAVAFVVVQQGVFSVYLGCSFAPNHKGMPVIPEGATMGFAERQVRTSRNIAGGRLVTFVLGGLNYQIEHHLFPTMPRPNLAKSRSVIQAYCLESGFGYCETSVRESYRQIVTHLRACGVAPPVTPPVVVVE